MAGETHAVDLQPAGPAAAAARIWRGLDKPWQEAFRQAWEALRTGNIAVGAVRLGPVATVRFAGPDRYWDGCHDFGKLSAREANRTQPARIGPRRDELGTFATLISRFVHLPPGYQEALRAKPQELNQWAGPYMPQDIPKDPWGHDYVYKYPGEHGDEPDIISYGADGQVGGDGLNADIASWKN